VTVNTGVIYHACTSRPTVDRRTDGLQNVTLRFPLSAGRGQLNNRPTQWRNFGQKGGDTKLEVYL